MWTTPARASQSPCHCAPLQPVPPQPPPSTGVTAHAQPVSGAPVHPWSWYRQHGHSRLTLDPALDSAQQCTPPSHCPHIHSQVKTFPRRNQLIKSGRGATSYVKTPVQDYKDMKNQGNMTPPKEHNKFMVTDTREMEIGKIFHKEFKAIVLKKLSYKTKNKQTKTNT